MRIDPDFWDEWQAHPLTETLVKLCLQQADKAREAWASASFDGGVCDPLTLARHRERAAVFKEIAKLSRETVEEELE